RPEAEGAAAVVDEEQGAGLVLEEFDELRRGAVKLGGGGAGVVAEGAEPGGGFGQEGGGGVGGGGDGGPAAPAAGAPGRPAAGAPERAGGGAGRGGGAGLEGEVEAEAEHGGPVILPLRAPLRRLGDDPGGTVREDHRGLDLVPVLPAGSRAPGKPGLARRGE